MTLGKAIITIAACIGILLFQKTKPKFLQILLFGFILSFVSSFFDRNLFVDFSFLSFGFLISTYLTYSLYHKNWLPASISTFALISFVFKIQRWPYIGEIQLSMIIPIILLIIVVFNFKKYKNELAILGIITAYAISEVIRFINYLIANT